MRNPARLLLAFGLALTALVFGGTLRFAFIYDDWPQIVRNPAVQGWSYVPGYFVHHVWSHIYPTWPGNYYRPLFLIWLRLNDALFGLQPLGWHATTVAAHLGVTAMVFWLARRLTRDDIVAAMAAAIFGVHPAHIETVAWVSGVSEPLLALFFIPAFVFFTKARHDGADRRRWLALSLLCYVGALLSKETAIVLPALVFGYAWVPRDEDGNAAGSRRFVSAGVACAPYVVLSLAYLVVRAVVLKGVGHGESNVGLREIVLTAPSLLWFYARHLVWPAPMSLFYDVEYVSQPSLRNFVLPVIVVLAIAAALVAWARRSQAAAMGVLWLALPLAPVIASISTFGRGELVHDRYLYLPSVGFALLLALGIARLRAGSAEFMGIPAVRALACFAIVGALAAATAVQSIHWANNLLLYHYGVQQAPRNALARIHLATEMLNRGDATSAMRLYHEARDLAPDMWQANFVLGFAYFQLRHLPEAERYLRAAAEIVPNNPNQYMYLALTLMRLSRLDEAEAAARRATALWSRGPGFHYVLGSVLEKKGDVAGARGEYVAELKNDPNSVAKEKIAELDRRAP
jgi:Tfp pilus assembly protein PilF